MVLGVLPEDDLQLSVLVGVASAEESCLAQGYTSFWGHPTSSE